MRPGRPLTAGSGTLPTLLFRSPAGYRVVPGWRPFATYAAAVEELCPGLLEPPVPLSPAEALERHRSLTGPEMELLTEAGRPPSDAVRVDTGNGPLWLHPGEAGVQPATSPRPSAGL